MNYVRRECLRITPGPDAVEPVVVSGSYPVVFVHVPYEEAVSEDASPDHEVVNNGGPNRPMVGELLNSQ